MTAASDMGDLAEERGGGRDTPARDRQGKGNDEIGHCGGAPVRLPVTVSAGYHPQMSSSPTMSGTSRYAINVSTRLTAASRETWLGAGHGVQRPTWRTA
ncbi:hypothetical protein GCM10010216_53070 [Streptomyces flaveolus]|nr:hypothetical protein GCM10010216_53070 [Streptomyces flaveolus]